MNEEQFLKFVCVLVQMLHTLFKTLRKNIN